jgi:hypothetical protein
MLTLNKHAAGDQHMRIFSRLARRIMHEDFRNALVNASFQGGYRLPAATRIRTLNEEE